MRPTQHTLTILLLGLIMLLIACDPLAPTPQTIIVTPIPSRTPTLTPTITETPTPTITPTPETPTPTPFPCDESSGQIITFDQFRSDIAGENLRYRAYVPPCYRSSERRFPYVILLHGAANTELQWEDIGTIEAMDQGIRLGVVAPMILIMPYFGSIGTFNQFPPEPSYEDVILEELMPAIERDFCTWNNREHRAIGGISRGGFWAMEIALRHPDLFGKVGGHSAFFPDGIPPAYNPLEMALNSGFLPQANLRIYIDNGAEDTQAAESLELFSSRLSSRGVPHTYVIHPIGNHDDEYWSAHIEDYLAFYSREWPRELSGLPSCADASPE